MNSKKLRKMAVLSLCAVSALSLCACSKDDTGSDGPSSSVDGEKVITTDELLSATGYDVDEYVELGDYRNLDVSIDESDYTVTDEMLESYMENDLTYYTEYAESDKETAEDGDVVNIDYVGTIDGKEIGGGSDTGYELTLGSDTFIDGFEDQIVGHSKGDEFDVNVTFPEDYSYSQYAGKDAVFHVTLNYIAVGESPTLDTLTDGYVEENMYSVNGCSTVEEYREYCKTQEQTALDMEKSSAVQTQVLEQLEACSTVSLTDEMIEEHVGFYIEQYTAYAEENDTTYEEYVVDNFGVADADEFETELKEDCKDELTETMLMEAVIKDYGFTITQGEFSDFIDSYINSYGGTEDEVYEYYGGKSMTLLYYAEGQMLETLVSMYS